MDFEDTFVISDHHFGHENILKFTTLDKVTKVRPGFSNVLQMNNYMIWKHNEIVKPTSKVYFLGDVAFNRKVFHEIMPRLNGRKTLIMGNHDDFDTKDYLMYFDRIRSSRYIKYSDSLKFVLCHYPMHPDANYPNSPICIHGHIHEKNITYEQDKFDENYQFYTARILDNRYVNVSVEQINYTPISLAEIARRYEKVTLKS